MLVRLYWFGKQIPDYYHRLRYRSYIFPIYKERGWALIAAGQPQFYRRDNSIYA